MLIDDTLLRPANNNLTLVRLALASAVIWTHAYWLVTGKAGLDELVPLLGAPFSVFAVDGFFFLSGFLVYASLQRRGSVADFVTARVARLWPALAVSVLLTAIVGGFVTTASPAAYFSGPTLRFIIGNLSLLMPGYSLTGVYCGTELCVVNGSLWTIPWEVRCYALLAILAFCGLANERFMRLVVLPGSLIGAIVWHVPGVSEDVTALVGEGVAYNLTMIDRLWTMFALGIGAFVFRHRIRLSWVVLAVLALASAWALRTGIGFHIDSLFSAYAVLCFGFLTARWRSVSGNWPDYSYGMYIYAFPVMIGLQTLFAFDHHAPLAMANALATLPLAALSWHLVEKPVLNRVARARKRESVAAPVV